MDLETKKAKVIEQFRQVNDEDLINAVKSMLDYAARKESDFYIIPEPQQQLVMERLEKIHTDPENLVDWESAKKILKEK